MPKSPEKDGQPEADTVVYVISKCWLDDATGQVLSVPLMGLQGELTDADAVRGCVEVLNASEEARFGPDARFFYSYRSWPKQLMDDFPF